MENLEDKFLSYMLDNIASTTERPVGLAVAILCEEFEEANGVTVSAEIADKAERMLHKVRLDSLASEKRAKKA